MRIATVDQLLDALDTLFSDGSDWTRRGPEDHWADVLSRPGHPLGSHLPDPCLADWLAEGLLPAPGPGRLRALDLGCGLGRNAAWLADQGFETTGADISPYAVNEARRRAAGSGTATYLEVDVLRERVPGGPFDLVHDSGLFHHLPPHRRISYRNALDRLLAPGGTFTIVSFEPGTIGSTADDLSLLRTGRLEGGMAYGADELREVFADLELVAAGPMRSPGHDGEHGGHPFPDDVLHAALFRRPPGSGCA